MIICVNHIRSSKKYVSIASEIQIPVFYRILVLDQTRNTPRFFFCDNTHVALSESDMCYLSHLLSLSLTPRRCRNASVALIETWSIV